jgi:methylmalonyl-CoA mutase
MKFPQVTAADWRVQVDKELAGSPFEKALVHRTAEGIPILPLYNERPDGDAVGVDSPAGHFRVCTTIDAASSEADVADDLAGGADALWLTGLAPARADALLASAGIDLARTFVVVDAAAEATIPSLERFARHLARPDVAFAWGLDPLGAVARGASAPAALAEGKAAIVAAARLADERFPNATVAMASTLPHHDAGAEAADEIAIALATGVSYLRLLIDAGLAPTAAARRIALRIAAGRDTFGELCKVRALRIAWRKVLAAAGASDAPRTLVHAVCSSRTMTQRDPWVNMLRVTTQVFAAALGGADLVTPVAFDRALGESSPLGRRGARNTGLVLREESAIGKVIDPAGGSYYFDTLTDALAREAWKRFQAIEREGGIEDALVSGRLRARLEAGWKERLELVAKRKAPILGVSDFANLGEKLPRPPPPEGARAGAQAGVALVTHRDAEAFEQLRARADAMRTPPEAILVALGPLAESRARVGFATNFFGAGGIRTREVTQDEPAVIACLCGSDERYAAEAALRVKALKAAGCQRVLVAGRPGPLEAALREAGADGFLFVGCDAVDFLSETLDAFR